MKKLILITALLSAPAMADSVSSAYKLCGVLDGSNMLSKPCEVSGWTSSVKAVIDTNGREGNKICAGVAQMARNYGLQFKAGWSFKIYSPYSSGNTIAQCKL